MKTTVEIADPLLRAARRKAANEGTTLRALVERGLRHVVDEAPAKKKKPFKMVTFGGEGLSPEFADKGWEAIRDAIYEGRGA